MFKSMHEGCLGIYSEVHDLSFLSFKKKYICSNEVRVDLKRDASEFIPMVEACLVA
jgi:hypothetical protein